MSQSLGALTTLLDDLGLSTSTWWPTTLWDSFLLKDYTSQLALRPEGGAMGGIISIPLKACSHLFLETVDSHQYLWNGI